MSRSRPVRVTLGVIALSLILPALAAAQAAASVVRTGDPGKRGLTEADFPRVQRLAEGVYSYEALRSAGEERFTTVSLIVVTSDGVVVADGQGNLAETQRMVEKIAELTPVPITHVVVGSDHGDHTGGNAAFPANVVYLAHPTSKAILEASAGRSGGAAPNIEAVPERRVLRMGGREIQALFLGRAHTGGDLHLYLPTEKILFMREAYLNRPTPALAPTAGAAAPTAVGASAGVGFGVLGAGAGSKGAGPEGTTRAGRTAGMVVAGTMSFGRGGWRVAAGAAAGEATVGGSATGGAGEKNCVRPEAGAATGGLAGAGAGGCTFGGA
jgi:hypothetical protein